MAFDLTAVAACPGSMARLVAATPAHAIGPQPPALAACSADDEVQGARVSRAQVRAQPACGVKAPAALPTYVSTDRCLSPHAGGKERPLLRRDGRTLRVALAASTASDFCFACAGSLLIRSSLGSQSSTAQMTSRSSSRMEIGFPDHRWLILPAEISRPASASARRRSLARQIPL